MEPETTNKDSLARIIISIMLGVFLAGIDATVVGTAMPTVVADLGGLSLYSWVFSAYMLTTAVSMPVFGKLSDLFGKKKIFYVAVGFFLLGSALSGLSENMVQLVIFRGLQGVGAGGLAAVPFALIGSVFPVHRRGRAYGLISAVWAISSIIGPMLGSLIVLQLSWRWVFYINIPIGITAAVLLSSSYRESVTPRRAPIDWLGAFSLTLTITSLLLVFLQLGEGLAILTLEVAGLSVFFLIWLIVFVLREQRARDPLISVNFFRVRAFSTGNVLGFLAGFCFFGVLAYVPLFVQNIQGGSAADVGLVITPLAIGWSGASIIVGNRLHRTGEKKIVRYGILAMLLGFGMAFFLQYDAPVWYVIACMLVIGVGMGMQTPALLLIVQNSLSASVIGVATSTHMLIRTMGGAVGVSLMGAVLTGSMLSKFAVLSTRRTLETFPAEVQRNFGDPHQLLSESVRSLMNVEQSILILRTFTAALHEMFVVGIVAMAASWILSSSLQRTTLTKDTRPSN